MLFKKDLKFASCMAVTVFLTLGLSISFSSLLAAWTAPTANPPTSNLSPLIHNEHTTPTINALINTPLGVSGNLTVSGGVITGNGSSITSLNASNLTTGTISNARLDADLQDLADGSLSGSKVGAGISGDNITDGSVDASELAANSVGASEITAGAVGTSEVSDNSLTANDLAANSCGNSEMIDDPTFSSITLGGVNKSAWPGGSTLSIVKRSGNGCANCPCGFYKSPDGHTEYCYSSCDNHMCSGIFDGGAPAPHISMNSFRCEQFDFDWYSVSWVMYCIE